MLANAPPVSNILMKNIYYMLAYAFRALNESDQKKITAEHFDNIHNLFAEILANGIVKQLKQGLHKEYVEKKELVTSLRGKIDIPGTIRLTMARRAQLHCEFDDFSENNTLNQVLKSAMMILIRSANITSERRSRLKKLMLFFSNVNEIQTSEISWKSIKTPRYNQGYRLLLIISRLIIENLLILENDGKEQLASFLDDQKMHQLFEKFILEYFKKHWPALKPRSPQIAWAIEQEELGMLPVMQSDIVLEAKATADAPARILIIDAKYYANPVASKVSGRATLISQHLYQIFTYVKNRQKLNADAEVSGLLLYANTNHHEQPLGAWRIAGNKIEASTLPLDQEFGAVADALDAIARRCFAESSRSLTHPSPTP